jgi:hypothetical protein
MRRAPLATGPVAGARRTALAARLAIVAPWVLLATFLAGDATAQTPFALVNMGQDVWVPDARIAGRGGWGMTVADTLSLGFKNIAGLASNPFLGIQLTGYGEVVDSQEGENTRTTSRAFAPNFRVSVPIKPGRVAITAGFKSRRSTTWGTREDKDWEVEDGTLSGFEIFDRKGTLWEVPLGASLRLGRFLSFGGTVNLVRGSVTQTRSAVFVTLNRGPDSTGVDVIVPSPYLRSVEEQKDTYSGTSYTASALLDFFGFLRFGAAYTPEHDVSLERKISLGGVGPRFNDAYTMRFPAEYQAGAELRVGRWRLGGDAEYQEYSQLTGQPEWEPDLEDAWTVSAGIERKLGRARRGGFGNLPLRLGASLRRWSYRVGGEPVDERSVSVGTGFAFEGGRGQLDLAVTYGTIGDLEKNGRTSEYWRLTLSVTGLERWW